MDTRSLEVVCRDMRPAQWWWPGEAAPHRRGFTMRRRTATKWFGAVVAALTLTMVTSVAPASAARDDGDRVQLQRRDTGWDIP
jgi:hypothetical protein